MLSNQGILQEGGGGVRVQAGMLFSATLVCFFKT